MTLARDLGYQVVEANLPRESLYIADEVFFTGTAAEVTPVRTIDRITIGSGKRGPVTAALQSAFFAVVNGDVPDTHGWLTYVYPEEASLREPAKAAAARGIAERSHAPFSTFRYLIRAHTEPDRPSAGGSANADSRTVSTDKRSGSPLPDP